MKESSTGAWIGVWIGDFSQDDDFYKYLKGKFSKDFIGMSWHAFEYMSPATDVVSLVSDFVNSTAYAEDAAKAAKAIGIKKGTSVILCKWRNEDEKEIATFKDVNAPMRFIGAFEEDPDVPSVNESKGNTQPVPADHTGQLSVWLGTLESGKEWKQYLAEQYEDDSEPISRFGKDFSLWYDHDFMESARRSKETTLETLLKGHSHSKTFAAAVIAAAHKKKITKANACILIYDYAFDQPGSDNTIPASRDDQKINRRAPVKFIGSFPFGSGKKKETTTSTPKAFVLSIGISPDQSMAVTGSFDGNVCLWDLSTGERMGKVRQEHSQPVIAILFFQDGQRCLTGSDRIRSWFPFPSATKSGSAFGQRLDFYALDDAQHRLAFCYSGGIMIYDTKRGKRIKLFGSGTSSSLAMTFLPDDTLFSIEKDGPLRWWDPNAGKCAHVIEREVRNRGAAISPSETQVAFVSEGKLQCWDLLKRQQTSAVKCKDEVYKSVFADERYLLTLQDEHPIKVWDLKSGKPISQLKGKHDWMTRIVVTDRGRKVITYLGDQHVFTIWDLKTGKDLCTYSMAPTDMSPENKDEHVVSCVAATSDGKTIIVSDRAERLLFLRWTRGKLVPL